MTPVISPWVFYLMYVCDNLSFVLSVASIISLIVCVIFLSVRVMFYMDGKYDGDSEKMGRAFGELLKKVVVPMTIALLTIACIVPDKNTLTQMIVAQNVTYERVEDAADVVQTVYEDIMNLFEEDTNED